MLASNWQIMVINSWLSWDSYWEYTAKNWKGYTSCAFLSVWRSWTACAIVQMFSDALLKFSCFFVLGCNFFFRLKRQTWALACSCFKAWNVTNRRVRADWFLWQEKHRCYKWCDVTEYIWQYNYLAALVTSSFTNQDFCKQRAYKIWCFTAEIFSRLIDWQKINWQLFW